MILSSSSSSASAPLHLLLWPCDDYVPARSSSGRVITTCQLVVSDSQPSRERLRPFGIRAYGRSSSLFAGLRQPPPKVS
eukprot:8573744-Heterocapsa_arctica.AAC.1